MLREAAPLAISGVFIAFYFRIDSVMLHAMMGERAVGLFGGIYRVFELLAMVAVAFRSVLFPVMARAADGPSEALAALFRKSMRVHLLFTIVVAVFLTIEARPIVRLVLGPGYEEAAPGLAILIWALPGSFMADTLIHLLIAKRQQLAATWAVALVGLFNVALNLVMIPRWSFVGASAATVVSEVMCFVLLFASFRRDVPGVSFARVAAPPLAAGALTGGALLFVTPWLPAGPLGLAIAAVASLAGYAGVLSLLRAIGREDLALLRDLLLPRSAP
jgi:O-antigen/teichoic acid export membrane protein